MAQLLLLCRHAGASASAMIAHSYRADHSMITSLPLPRTGRQSDFDEGNTDFECMMMDQDNDDEDAGDGMQHACVP